MSNTFIPDASQQKVIDIDNGYHLVLAPPGCGKTQILACRVGQAHAAGIPYSEMLCLTFTNRAARGMQQRINDNINDDTSDLFVGNVHRFCSRYLFDSGIVAASSSIIDDADALSIMCQYTNDDEQEVAASYKRMREYNEAIFLSHLMYQINHNYPRDLRLHGDCLNSDDVKVLDAICKSHKMPFTAKSMNDIYMNTDFYRDSCSELGMQQIIYVTLKKMQLARNYEKYKETNNLLDFEDILLLSYDSLKNKSLETTKESKSTYSWIQVDEVQDLNPLQLAIIDLLSPQECNKVVVYLGDPQQSIFSFMGAKMSTLELLRNRCKGNIHTLSHNHRSPKYLLDAFNAYAVETLNISQDILPTTDYVPQTIGNELQLYQSETIDTEYLDAAQQAIRLVEESPEDTTAIIVSSNRDADAVSNALKNMHASHFKISGDDLFSSAQVKLLFAHLTILSNEQNFIAWARVLNGMKVFQTTTAARNFVQSCEDRAMLPLDFLLYEDSTYIQQFVSAYETKEITIFDTETTGLDVFNDDILQIAAVKIRNGEIVDGSQLSIYIESDKPIPEMLGDIVNPIIEERKHQILLSRKDAFCKFMNYIGDSVLLGHNADYDINILKNNLRREFGTEEVNDKLMSPYIDSLRLIKLLCPQLRQYKLKYLLEMLHLEGENSHLADADVDATRSLVLYCYSKAKEIIDSQLQFMQQKRVKDRVKTLRDHYGKIYAETRNMLWSETGDTQILVSKLKQMYDNLLAADIIQPLDNISYIFNYIASDVINSSDNSSLITQLSNHMLEINTLKEADLCGSDTINEKIFVTTVHKAKGLEFDNVIVFDAIEGRYPNYYSKNNKTMLDEDARKFYVAITRTRKRLIIMQSCFRVDYHGYRQPVPLTRFADPIKKSSNIWSVVSNKNKE